MKNIIVLCAALAALSVRADGLKQNLVPANTRWLLHLDGEVFRKSRIGAMIVEDKFESKVRKLKEDSQLDLDFSFNKITALTAFGPKVGEANDGVLVVQTAADVRGDLEKLIGFKEKNGNGEPPVGRMTANGVEFYTLGGDLNLTEAAPKVWLVGKNKTSLAAAREVVAGKPAALKDASFLDYPAVSNSFFLLAVADTGSAGDRLPAQAKILQKAEGGRVTIGEEGDKLLLNLALRSKDGEVLAQIHQVVQGLIAFVTLSQSDNKDLAALASSASVSTNASYVSVSLKFPLERAMKKVRAND